MKNIFTILGSVLALVLGSANVFAQAHPDSGQTDGLVISLEEADIQKWVVQNAKLYILLSDEGKGRLSEVTSGNLGETLTIEWRTHTIISVPITGAITSGRMASSNPSDALLSDLRAYIPTQSE